VLFYLAHHYNDQTIRLFMIIIRRFVKVKMCARIVIRIVFDLPNTLSAGLPRDLGAGPAMVHEFVQLLANLNECHMFYGI
jgi:hypothetical protein